MLNQDNNAKRKKLFEKTVSEARSAANYQRETAGNTVYYFARNREHADKYKAAYLESGGEETALTIEFGNES